MIQRFGALDLWAGEKGLYLTFAEIFIWGKWLLAIMAVKRLEGVTPEVNLYEYKWNVQSKSAKNKAPGFGIEIHGSQ